MKWFRLSLVASLFTTAVIAAEGWMTDYDAALKKAKAENKTVLLDFSGSDWCGWCVRLDKEVFSKDEFKAYAKDNLVTVLIDFPRKKQLDATLKKQNQELAEKFKIRGFPTVVLLNSEGEKIAQTGYRKGGPEAYVKHLKELIAKAAKAETDK